MTNNNTRTQDHGPSEAPTIFLDIESIQVAAWCRDSMALTAPEEVHLALRVHGVEAPLIGRFKGPDTLGSIIDQLIEYRDTVWPEAASKGPVELDPVPFPQATTTLTAPPGVDCGDLPVAMVPGAAISRWVLPDSARVLLAKGASVWLFVLGDRHPPVGLHVAMDGPFPPGAPAPRGPRADIELGPVTL